MSLSSEPGQDARADLGVLAHLGLLRGVERARLAEDRVRHADLADVVDDAGVAHALAAVGGEAERAGRALGVAGDRLRVRGGAGVADVQRLGQPQRGGELALVVRAGACGGSPPARTRSPGRTARCGRGRAAWPCRPPGRRRASASRPRGRAAGRWRRRRRSSARPAGRRRRSARGRAAARRPGRRPARRCRAAGSRTPRRRCARTASLSRAASGDRLADAAQDDVALLVARRRRSAP